MRFELWLALVYAGVPGGVIAQTPADRLTRAATDSVMDAVMMEVRTSYALGPLSEGTFLSPYATYRSDSAYHETHPLPEHDAAWLSRMKAEWGFTAVCADAEPRRCPPRNGGIYIAMTAPRPTETGMLEVRARVYRRWPSTTARYGWEAGEESYYLTRVGGRWEVFCRGMAMHEEGSGGKPATGE